LLFRISRITYLAASSWAVGRPTLAAGTGREHRGSGTSSEAGGPAIG
jgi:hypothetical protein